jgi:hypothetical protein
MTLIIFRVHELDTNHQYLDYIQLERLDEVLGWLAGLGSQIAFTLNKGSQILTAAGWETSPVSMPNLIQVISDDEKTLFKVDSIRSDDGILFEDVKHCSGLFVDLMAAKWEFKQV